MREIKCNFSRTSPTRRHYLTAEDVNVVLLRLPEETWSRLRAVHFNDRARGRRTLGYVNMGHREIAICALPPRVSLSQCLAFSRSTGRRHGRSPREFGALRGRQWPELAVRRFLLYHVFLHELGHLQLVDPKAQRLKRRFAGETMAQEFADYWRARLWSHALDHPDPVHNPPTWDELAALERIPSGEVGAQPVA
jgi:hypothetical protein